MRETVGTGQEARRADTSVRPYDLEAHGRAPSVGREPAGLLRRCACGQHTGGGECAECKRKRLAGIQTKLEVGAPGDAYEQEADRMAERVMRMPEPGRAPTGGRPYEDVPVGADPRVGPSPFRAGTPIQRADTLGRPCEEGPDPGRRGTPPWVPSPALLRVSAASSPSVPAVSPALESSIDSQRGAGAPLSPATRAFFEPRFGRDFSRVRVHAGDRAATAAREVEARAFTLGSDIFFSAGRWAPDTAEGKSLLAHELTHVVQQGQSDRLRRQAEPAAPESTEPEEQEAGDGQEAAPQPTRRPVDTPPDVAGRIGQEALSALGYERILELARQAGFVESRAPAGGGGRTVRRMLEAPANRLQRNGATFGQVFGRFAVAAGIASQLDTPAPGPGDVVALGILVVGLVVAGVVVATSSSSTTTTTTTTAPPTTAPPTTAPPTTTTRPPTTTAPPTTTTPPPTTTTAPRPPSPPTTRPPQRPSRPRYNPRRPRGDCAALLALCVLTSMNDLPGSVEGASRCYWCYEACTRSGGYWGGRVPHVGTWRRCDFWNFRRVRSTAGR